MDPWDFRQQVMMAGGYVPILGNYDPTRGQQAAAALPDASSTWSSSYPATTAAPAATTAATSYRYSPRTSTGSRNRYAELMSQYEQAQPFSFFGYPQSYSGGYDVTPYTPSAAPVNRYADIMAQSVMGDGRRGTPEAPSAWSQMTPAERAAYYAANPTEGKLALGAQDLFGNVSLLGQVSKYFGKDGWYDSRLEKMGYDPEQFAYGPPDPNFSNQGSAAARNEAMQAAIAAANASGGGFTANPMSSDPAQQAAAIRQAEANSAAERASEAAADQGGFTANPMSSDPAQQAAAIRQAEADSAARREAPVPVAQSEDSGGYDKNNPRPVGRDGGGGGAISGGGGLLSSQSSNTRNALRSNEGYGGNYKGGPISMQHLQGPDPEGPDDGYASLKDGEYVINDKAVKKYGIELMNAINSGKISKGKLRGLLEM
jgi:hypothetical protein